MCLSTMVCVCLQWYVFGYSGLATMTTMVCVYSGYNDLNDV
jgi:hypothetical protein